MAEPSDALGGEKLELFVVFLLSCDTMCLVLGLYMFKMLKGSVKM